VENDQQFAKIGLIILLLGLALLYSIVGDLAFPDHPVDKWPEERPFYQVVGDNNGFVLLWSRENLFAGANNDCCPRLAAAAGKVFLDGIFDRPGYTQILAFDGKNGTLLWQKSDPLHSVTTLQATSTALYAGFDANGPVRAYRLATGDLLWSNTMPGEGAFPPRYTRRLRVADNLIYLEASNTLHFVRADTGEVLKTLDASFTDEDTQQAVAELAQTLGIPVEPKYFWRDAITRDATFFKLESGKLRAYDRQSDDLLWETERVICNVVATESTVFFLTKERKLLGVTLRSGEIIVSAQFERIEPDNYTPSSRGPATSCYVAADKYDNLVYVFWGAGAQLFAFRVVE
jgi:hypothetical protein